MIGSSGEIFHVKVKFTEQQSLLLDKLLAEGSFGSTYSEVVTGVFAEYLRSNEKKKEIK
ncbi:hypothetical protein ACMTN4_01955 (plasmid) [Rhodococcus globerulus]|uniref:hypothetical protein n=1 Tax=Rhodococcus globerulus TaxID=33008 RepID=UPI0039EBD7B5